MINPAQPKNPAALLGILLGFASLLGAVRTPAQVVDSTTGSVPGLGDVQHDPSLRITLDRLTFRAFEPVYLAITSKQFLTETTPEVSVWQGDGPPLSVSIDDASWMKGETLAGGSTLLQRQGVPLQLRSPAAAGAARDYLFPTAGDYKMRVKVGDDTATLKVKVVDTEPRERDAWNDLGNRVDAVINNALRDPPEQTLVYTATKIMKGYPGTVCAGYCQAYMSVAKFKIAYTRSGRGGGKDAYAGPTAELLKVQEAFGDTFMGEQTGFYAAYSAGLTKNFKVMLEVCDNLKTHVTPFSDGLSAMRDEVLEHLHLVPAEVAKALPLTSLPTTAPAQREK